MASSTPHEQLGIFRPGMQLMRRMRIGYKLTFMTVAFLMPFVYSVWQIVALREGGKAAAGAASGTQLVVVLVVSSLVLAYLMMSFYRSLKVDVGRLLFSMNAVAQGNLRVVNTVRCHDEMNDLADMLAKLINGMSTMTADVNTGAALVTYTGKVLVRGNAELSDRTEQQAANLEETTASVQDIALTVQANADTAVAVEHKAADARALAEQGAKAMAGAVESVEAIQKSAQRMNEIIGVIDGLAFQTNILALNAAVEAARAGESGRGFAVVASEVRSLAQRSAESAREIRLLIQTSSTQVEDSVGKIRGLGSSIGRIASGIREVAEDVSRISAASGEQSAKIQEVSAAIRQLDEITQRNADMVHRASEQAHALENRAASLTVAAAGFQLKQGIPTEAVALVERAVARRRQTSREIFLRDLTAPESGFVDRDMYVFALDRNGKYLAFGGNTAKVGTRVQDVPGIDGDGLTAAIVNQAEQEPGWVQYDITNPATGKVQTKMSYVWKVDEYYLGCGVYTKLAV